MEIFLYLAGRYLAHNIDDKGVLAYTLNPTNGKTDSPPGTSPMLRNMAGAWVLAEIANYFGSNFFRDAAKRHLGYIAKNFFKVDGEIGYLNVGEKPKLGMSAFFVLAHNSIGDPNFLKDESDRLTKLLLFMENKELGCIYPWYTKPLTTSAEDPGQVYYPGEALTALMALYDKYKKPEYIELTKRVFPFYQKLFRTHKDRRGLIGWMSKPYSKVFLHTGDQKYADFVFELADLICGEQKTNSSDPFTFGSFQKSKTSYSTGVWLEGVAEALGLATHMGDEKRVQKYTAILCRGFRYIYQLQYNDNRIFKKKLRDKILGGIATSPNDLMIRSDNQQHCGYSTLRALQIWTKY
jgi:hypothetical protein